MKELSPILYVDDEPANLELFSRYFEDDYVIHTACSGREALDVLGREPIQLLITDQRMPGMTGTELLEATREPYPDLSRVIVTAHSDVRVILQAIELGRIDHYVTKPWDPDELRIAIDRALDGYELRWQHRQHRQLFDDLEKRSGRIPIEPLVQTTLRPTVLYVDGMETHRSMFERSFHKVYVTYTAGDSSEALRLLASREIHLLLADQRLPGSSGLELLEATAEESPETLRFLVTAFVDIAAVVRAIDAGRVYSYITKPWNPQELRLALDSAVEVFNLRRSNAALLAEIERWDGRLGCGDGGRD